MLKAECEDRSRIVRIGFLIWSTQGYRKQSTACLARPQAINDAASASITLVTPFYPAGSLSSLPSCSERQYRREPGVSPSPALRTSLSELGSEPANESSAFTAVSSSNPFGLQLFFFLRATRTRVVRQLECVPLLESVGLDYIERAQWSTAEFN
jgi:hypothetical protein